MRFTPPPRGSRWIWRDVVVCRPFESLERTSAVLATSSPMSRFVSVEDQVTCRFCTSVRRYPAVSGDVVAVSPPRPSEPRTR